MRMGEGSVALGGSLGGRGVAQRDVDRVLFGAVISHSSIRLIAIANLTNSADNNNPPTIKNSLKFPTDSFSRHNIPPQVQLLKKSKGRQSYCLESHASAL